jgi:malonyl CoA-acyl carrier protein transacylase
MTTYLFPGQGSQVNGMGRDLFDAFPELTEQVDQILGYSIKVLCLENSNQQLHQTQYTQPALYVVNALSYRKRQQETKTSPNYLAGHSLGEYNALEAAGVFSFEDGLKLVQKRGELMSQAPEGAMAAILNLNADTIRQCLDENNLSGIDIANYNAPSQTVISGLKDDVIQAQVVLEQAGAVYVPLNTSGAFHSRYMETVQSQFAEFMQAFTFSEPRIPVISNVHAMPYEPGQVMQNLTAQITQSVNWLTSIRYLLVQGETEFIELGIGDVLTKLTAKIQAAESTNETQAVETVKPVATEEKKEDEPASPSSPKEPVQQSDNTKIAREQEIEALRQRIEDWNRHYPIGTRVRVDGYDEPLETRTRAMILFGHRAAIYLKEYNGYFALEDVQPLTAATDSKTEASL